MIFADYVLALAIVGVLVGVVVAQSDDEVWSALGFLLAFLCLVLVVVFAVLIALLT